LRKFIKQSNGVPKFVSGLDDEHDGDTWKGYQKKQKDSGGGGTNRSHSSITEEDREAWS